MSPVRQAQEAVELARSMPPWGLVLVLVVPTLLGGGAGATAVQAVTGQGIQARLIVVEQKQATTTVALAVMGEKLARMEGALERLLQAQETAAKETRVYQDSVRSDVSRIREQMAAGLGKAP